MLAAIGKPPFENVNDQEGFLIVTAAASEGLQDIHDRRPLVYLADAARKWLSENLNCKEAEDIAREGSISAEDFIWHPVSRAVVNSRKPGPGTYRAAGLANGEIPCIHSQGYAPFLWITHSLFYSPEQQPGKSKKNYPCRTRNTSNNTVYIHSNLERDAMILFVTPASEPALAPPPLFAERCPAGFPSPAVFPSGSGCQSERPDGILNILNWLETTRECNQPLVTLTIFSVLKALDSNGIGVSIDGIARSPDCSFAAFTA